MNSSPGTHIDTASMHAYAAQTAGPALEVAIEQHLLACTTCRQRVAMHNTLPGINPERLQAAWDSIDASITSSNPEANLNRRKLALFQRIRTYLSRDNFALLITRGRLNAIAAVAVVAALAGVSGLLVWNAAGSADLLAQSPQVPPSVSQYSLHVQADGQANEGGAAPVEAARTDDQAVGDVLDFLRTDYIDVMWSAPITVDGSLQEAQATRDQLYATGITTSILMTGLYPNLRYAADAPVTDSFIVYAGPFGDLSAALAFCDKNIQASDVCLPVQPNPSVDR